MSSEFVSIPYQSFLLSVCEWWTLRDEACDGWSLNVSFQLDNTLWQHRSLLSRKALMAHGNAATRDLIDGAVSAFLDHALDGLHPLAAPLGARES